MANRGWVYWLKMEHMKIHELEGAYIQKKMSPSMVSNFFIIFHSLNYIRKLVAPMMI